ncbi:MAG: HD domain-containing protein [Oscillospiraceae bacterium]|nr:HD domain-containing protein [Oscillospiraceae bacterium]
MVKIGDVRQNEEIKTYIRRADESVGAMGYTEHSFAHMNKCSQLAGRLLREMGCDERTAELGEIAAYLHDIGNMVNREDLSQSGAMMAFFLLNKMGMGPEEISTIVAAIGNHDESNGFPVNAPAAALILADKSDVRRSRVRNRDAATFDIHDRVNYAVEHGALILDKEGESVALDLVIDTEICAVMDYFEIFLDRMLLCRRAAAFFSLKFGLIINGNKLL